MNDNDRQLGQVISGKTAAFDEIDAVWLSVMDISNEQFKLRLEMIREFKTALREFFKWQTDEAEASKEDMYEYIKRKSPYHRDVLQAIYLSLVIEYFDKFVRLVNSELTDEDFESEVSDFSARWISRHTDEICKKIIDSTCDIYKKDSEERNNQAVQPSERDFDKDEELEKSVIFVARNEMLAVCSLAAFEALKQSGYKYKEWCSVIDTKTRKSHLLANGQIRKLDEPFIIGTNKMMFPQDDSLGADLSDIINCRCCLKIKVHKRQ